MSMSNKMDRLYNSGKKKFHEMSVWINDRKPTCLNNVIGNGNVCRLLDKYVKTNRLPDIMLVGDYGSGKRTIAYLTARQYLGEWFSEACLEIDGAIYRGKDVISTGKNSSSSGKQGLPSGPNVMEFSRARIFLPDGKKKVIIIYNFNDMTIEAQNAMRRIMEKCEPTTRFILICNQLEDIIEAIQSRCIPLQTRRLTKEDSLLLIKTLNPELVKIGAITNLIIILSDGDMKKIINYVQTLSILGKDEVTIDRFHRIFNIPPVRLLRQLIVEIAQGKDVFKKIQGYLLDQGHNYNDILEILSKILAYDDLDITENQRYRYLSIVSKHYCESTPYANDIHLYELFASLND